MPHLDSLRFFAAMSIVVLHFVVRMDFGPWQPWVLERSGDLRLFVDLFFVISGFVIARFYGEMHDARSYGHFLKKRVARLAPLHFATLAFFVLVGLAVSRGLFHSDHAEEFDLSRLPANLLALHSWWAPGLSFNGPSWSISAEWTMYLAFPVMAVIGRRGWAVPLALGLAFALSFLPGRPWVFWQTHLGFVRALPSFLLGVGLYAARARLARLPMAGPLLGCALVAFGAGIVGDKSPYVLLLIVYLIAALAVAADYGPDDRRLALKVSPLGSLTYSVYMLHQLVLMLLGTFVGQRILHLKGLPENVWAVFCIGMVMVLGYLSLELFETPARRWINGLNLPANWAAATKPQAAAQRPE
jgi:peptidoglycan/LPS O-acetylase OafA/YrhL